MRWSAPIGRIAGDTIGVAVTRDGHLVGVVTRDEVATYLERWSRTH